jgi:hypothetical protein
MIEAVRNLKTQALFIYLEDGGGGRVKVINPAGQVLNLPDTLFEIDILEILPESYQSDFTPAQLTALDEYSRQSAQNLDAVMTQAEPSGQSASRDASKIKPKRKPASPKLSYEAMRAGVRVSWSTNKLTFYKHQIEPLSPHQYFRITVFGVGEVEISKKDFLTHFNEVTVSAKYISEGLFVYPEFPEKARKFLKNAAPAV